MSIAMMKAKAVGSGGAVSERSVGERSEPKRSGETAWRLGSHDSEVLEYPVRRRFTAGYKAQIVREAEACTEPGQIGAILRREGLYSSYLDKWRKKYELGGAEALKDNKRGRKPTRHPLMDENERLRKRNVRLEQRLKQAETIIDIQKKSPRCWAFPWPASKRAMGTLDGPRE
jgi:transposase-like protein